MRKIHLLIVISTMLLGCTEQNLKDHFVLNGRVNGSEEGWLFLYYSDTAGARIKDSSQLVDGEFSFRGTINEPSMAYLQLKEEKRSELNSASFFLEPANMKAELQYNNFANGRFDGSATQRELDELNKSKEPVMNKMIPLRAEYELASTKYREAVKAKKGESELDSLKGEADAVHARFDPFNADLMTLDWKFFANHPTSPVTAYMIRFHINDLPIDTLMQIYDRMGTRLQQSDDAKNLLIEIKQLRNGSPGNPATGFSTIDINGDSLRLSDFRGKYVLLDFWASWCGPCRKGNPHLKEVYAKLKGKGIEFIGISDDDSKPDAWRKAVEKDGLPWRHVLRGFDMAKQMKNEPNDKDLSDKFGIHSLPTKILIDPNGMIIGRYNDETGPLDQKLAEVFGLGETTGKMTGDSHIKL